MIDSNPVKSTQTRPAGWPRHNSIELDKVSLGYDGFDLPLVKQLDLHIKPGENVVICGRDGSGKSSLLSAISGLIRPIRNLDGTVGRILIGEEDISNISNKDLHKCTMLLGTVPFIFTGSLRANLDPFGEYADERIRKCLKEVQLWHEIKARQCEDPDAECKAKLDYELSEAGIELSIGSQQKLNIARALLREPEVLLLESATSCMDEFTEEEIMKTIRTSLRKSTVVMITQQLDTTIESERVIYMSHGRIKEMGNPMELLKNPDSHIAQMVKSATPELYIRRVVSKDSGMSDKEARMSFRQTHETSPAPPPLSLILEQPSQLKEAS